MPREAGISRGRKRSRYEKALSEKGGGSIEREYSVHCGMPYCTAWCRVAPKNVPGDQVTKRKAVRYFRDQGWSRRDLIGWTCGNHDGYERREVKRTLEGAENGT